MFIIDCFENFYLPNLMSFNDRENLFYLLVILSMDIENRQFSEEIYFQSRT